MIRTSRQLKALVRNLSKGNSTKAQLIIRNYAMERFIERISISRYNSRVIIKGGVLIAAMIGLDNRSTMDVDATIKGIDLTVENVRLIIDEIKAVKLNDGVHFEIKSIERIMDEADYYGIRVSLETVLETMRTPLKVDFSTGDVITPHEISFPYKLMFEERTIPILAYNLETLLAEKLETLLSRGVANTRMRDFYDIFAITSTEMPAINDETLRQAFAATVERRGSVAVTSDVEFTLDECEVDSGMIALWGNYQRKFGYASQVTWEMVMQSVRRLVSRIDLVKVR